MARIKYEYLLIAIALLWILFFSFTIQLTPYFSVIGDDGSYLYAARLLYFNSQLDNTRPLLITIIHGVPYLFGFTDGIVIKWGIFINFFSWFFTAVFLYKIISKIVDRKYGFLFSVLFIFCIGNLAHCFNFLSESIFIFLIIYSVYFILKYYETTKHYYITIAISILFLNTLIKPVSIGLALILLVFFITKMDKIILNKFSFLLIVSFSLIFFQMYSLKKNYGDYTLSYISSITYYNYLGDKADCYKKGIEFIPGKTERSKKFGLLSSHEMKEIAGKDLIDQLKNNTLNLFKAYLFCIYSNTHKGNFIVSECKNEKNTSYFAAFHFLFKAVSKIQNILFTILGIFLSFKCIIKPKEEASFYTLLSSHILYLFLVSGISCFQCDRFHIVFFPLVILLLSKEFITTKKSIWNKFTIVVLKKNMIMLRLLRSI
ncbi:MAG: hypothetical protein IM568_02790 [Flavobacterium sp.]|nr:hypothetical protein [Flavobacterium sp.]